MDVLYEEIRAECGIEPSQGYAIAAHKRGYFLARDKGG